MKTNLILPAILLVFAMMMLNVEADPSSSSSFSSSISVAGDNPSSIITITGITISGINTQLPAADVRTSTETFATGDATAFAEAFSEALAANRVGAMIEESSQSCSISYLSAILS